MGKIITNNSLWELHIAILLLYYITILYRAVARLLAVKGQRGGNRNYF